MGNLPSGLNVPDESKTIIEQLFPIVAMVCGVLGAVVAWVKTRDMATASNERHANDTFSTTIQGLLAQSTSQQASIDSMQGQLNSAMQSLITQAGELGVLKGKVESLEKMREELQLKIKALTAECIRLRKELEESVKANGELSQQNDVLHELLEQAKRALAELEAKYRKLAP
jgi:chromosome segregation ATPase